jgi:hypothetical protein
MVAGGHIGGPGGAPNAPGPGTEELGSHSLNAAAVASIPNLAVKGGCRGA